MPLHHLPPGPGQESVWDYPRPPRVEATAEHVVVVFNGVTIAETRRALRVLETSHPPAYYLPPADVRLEYFASTARRSLCEWKGRANYYAVRVGHVEKANVAWYYPAPARGYEALQNHIALYPQHMEACFVDGERVRPQPGGFYGGWITQRVVGPFKGEPGTEGW